MVKIEITDELLEVAAKGLIAPNVREERWNDLADFQKHLLRENVLPVVLAVVGYINDQEG